MEELSYPVQVLVPDNGLCELVRLITAIRVACVDAGGIVFGVEFSEDELQAFFDTHPHRYFEVKPKGAIDRALKKLTKAVRGSIENGDLKLAVARVNFDNGEVCLLNSWVEFSAFEGWCESRSIVLGECWYELYDEEQKIAQAASEEGEKIRRRLEGQTNIEELKEEFDGDGMDSLFAEINLLRAKLRRQPDRPEKPLDTREHTSYRNIIGAMLAQLTAGKANDTTVINQAISDYGTRPGISERKLQEVFAAAKRSLGAG